MLAFFLVWSCSDALFTDCQVSAPASWQGPAAIVECEVAAPELARQAAENPENAGRFLRAFCESQSIERE